MVFIFLLVARMVSVMVGGTKSTIVVRTTTSYSHANGERLFHRCGLVGVHLWQAVRDDTAPSFLLPSRFATAANTPALLAGLDPCRGQQVLLRWQRLTFIDGGDYLHVNRRWLQRGRRRPRRWRMLQLILALR